jgi:amidophosphoribosyltransferase
VIPIPDTSRTAALQMSYALGVKYREGFIKNRYIGRTFIMPGQAERKKSVRAKLNAIDVEFKGKNVLLVDDSIVRGTTSAQIIQMAREAGARKVYFASAAPPVRYPNVYGIDMPAASELVASGRTEDEVCRLIGADGLIYQDLSDLIESAREGNPRISRFDASCFDGVYVTGDVSLDYLKKVERNRNDAARSERAAAGANEQQTAEVLTFPR